MTDRELLEQAAKAAGIDTSSDIYDEDGLHIFYKPKPLVGNDRWYWNPLTDDGDALRLAVKLRLAVNIYNSVVVYESAEEYIEKYFPDGVLDVAVETRRAIVRAAAEAGKSVK